MEVVRTKIYLIAPSLFTIPSTSAWGLKTCCRDPRELVMQGDPRAALND